MKLRRNIFHSKSSNRNSLEEYVLELANIMKVIKDTINSKGYDFSHWYNYDFETDCCPDSNEIEDGSWRKLGYTPSDIERAEFDWVRENTKDILDLVLKKLGGIELASIDKVCELIQMALWVNLPVYK